MIPAQIALEYLKTPTTELFMHASREEGTKKTVFTDFAGVGLYMSKLQFMIS